MAERKLPDDPVAFICECLRGGRILWTYHINMHLGQHFIARETIIAAAGSYEVVEAYMGGGSQNTKEAPMKCTVCGARMSPVVTDLPFKLSAERIVILKRLPVLQCEACREYLIEDAVMARIDMMLEGTDSTAELEVLRYGA